MHVKTDSEVTSLADSSPPRSPRGGGGGGGRQIYYVMSPSHPDVEKVSFGGSSPGGSPIHHFHHQRQQQQHQHQYYYASSPIHYSRESTATRLSASMKLQPFSSAWQKLQRQHHTPSHHSASGAASDLSDEDSDAGGSVPIRCYVAWFILGFFVLFTLFSLIIWAASKPYKPEIAIKSVIFESYDIHAGMDLTGVPTKMLSINSTVKITFRNPATFFGVHVSATPLELFYFDFQIATGQMKEFYQTRKSRRTVTIVVSGQQVPLYGGGSSLTSRTESGTAAVVPLDLRFVVRARAYVLGHLVITKFNRHIHCSLILRETRLDKPLRLNNGCSYHD